MPTPWLYLVIVLFGIAVYLYGDTRSVRWVGVGLSVVGLSILSMVLLRVL